MRSRGRKTKYKWMRFPKCQSRMIGPFIVHILIGWISDGDHILLISFLQMRTTFVIYFIPYIGVECPPESTPSVTIGAKTIVGLMLLSAL